MEYISSLMNYFRKSEIKNATSSIVEETITKQIIPQQGRLFIRISGLSGAAAILLAAYGAHAFTSKSTDPKFKTIFDTGSRYHLIHSVALLAVPLTRKPYLTGSLLVAGTAIFSGCCYGYALTEDKRISRFTPFGGILLAVAWLSMAF